MSPPKILIVYVDDAVVTLFKKLCFHAVYTNTEWIRLEIDPYLILFSNSCIFDGQFSSFLSKQKIKLESSLAKLM